MVFIEAKHDIRLVQISFDGNNTNNPPNLIEGDVFERVNNEVNGLVNSCIDVIYKDAYEFIHCDVNQKAAITLELLSTRK